MTTMTMYAAMLTEPLDVRTRAGLLQALDLIADEGWDGPTGAAVLRYALAEVVAPVVRSVGIADSVAEFAESTGWAAAWETLCSTDVRDAASPWGFVRSAVRIAVAGEQLAEAYGTTVNTAWQIRRSYLARVHGRLSPRYGWSRVADPAALSHPVSLTALADAGYEPEAEAVVSAQSCPRLAAIADLLTRHGWAAELAHAAVLHVAENARPNPAGPVRAHGWREMAAELGIPGWQARRVTVLVVGALGWPGLVERLAAGGTDALSGPVIEAAVRATCEETMRPPVRAAREVEVQEAVRMALAS
jgi:hypothetical protein